MYESTCSLRVANIEGNNAPALARISSTPHQARILLSLVIASELDSVLAAVIESLPTSLVGTPRARMTALDIFVNLVRASDGASDGNDGDASGGDASCGDADFPACWRAVCAIADQSDGSPQLLVSLSPSCCGLAFRPLAPVSGNRGMSVAVWCMLWRADVGTSRCIALVCDTMACWPQAPQAPDSKPHTLKLQSISISVAAQHARPVL